MTTHAHHLGDVPRPMPIRQVGVVGGGTMGSGILVAFLDAGVERATMVEVNQAALDKSLGMVKAIYASRVRRGQMTAEQAAAVGEWRGPYKKVVGGSLTLVIHAESNPSPKTKTSTAPRVRGALALEDLKDADLVVEAVFEDMALKKGAFLVCVCTFGVDPKVQSARRVTSAPYIQKIQIQTDRRLRPPRPGLQARGHPRVQHLHALHRRDRRRHGPPGPGAGDALLQPGSYNEIRQVLGTFRVGIDN